MSVNTLQTSREQWQVKPLRDVPSGGPEMDLLISQPLIYLNFTNILNQLPCVTWILDVRTRTYAYISNNTLDQLGFHHDQYVTKGPDFHDEIKNPADRVAGWNLLRQVWRILSAIPSESKLNYKFSYDYRIVKPDGKTIRILEQNSVLRLDEFGNVTHLLGVCNDITEWKRGGAQLASLTSIHDKQCFLFSSAHAASVNAKTLLSKRELEILKLVSEGHGSKYIAEKLFISFHTVNTHRQKMIEKTQTRNASGLVQFAICNGLI
jgi:DNA-binding CsgD family transcriptional regulator